MATLRSSSGAAGVAGESRADESLRAGRTAFELRDLRPRNGWPEASTVADPCEELSTAFGNPTQEPSDNNHHKEAIREISANPEFLAAHHVVFCHSGHISRLDVL